MEEWKWIDGYEGIYQISNQGRLKSFKKDPDGMLLSCKNKSGAYLVRSLSKDGAHKTVSLHILVARAFIGEIPKGYHVHHKDGDKQNNRVDNLEIIHPSKHRAKTLSVLPQIEEGMRRYNKYVRPRPIGMYDMSGNLIATFPNSVAAQYVTGICQRNILQVAAQDEYKKGKTRKQAGGFVWKFEDRGGG